MAPGRWILQWVLLATIFSTPGFAKTPAAYEHVDRGIEKYQTGDFVAAEQAFAAASSVVPEDSRPIFDQACALAAQGKLDEAETLYERAKLARDPKLRASSLYNLGCLAADRAKAKFGERPEEAAPEVRAEGLKSIEQAVARYRDCLSIDPDHSDARHNLELLRLWVKHMQEVWKQRDRDKRRQEMGLLEFLEMIQSEQKQLRRQSRELSTVEDSPRRRQASSQLGLLQRELSEEILPLQQKIRDSAQPPASAGQPPQQSPEAEAALAAIIKVTEQTKSAMARASVDLIANNLADVEESQRQSLDELQKVYQAVAPLEHLLQKAIQLEKGLIETTQATEDSAFEEHEKKWLFTDLPYEQRQLADSIAHIPPKADQARLQLQAQPAVAGPAPPPGSNNGSDPKADRDAMLAAYQKAIELAPQARTAADEAATHLEQQSWPEAKVKEQETLKILEEIASQFPQQPQDPQQNPQNDPAQQDNQDSQKKDQDKKDQDKEKEGNKQDQKKDGEKKKDEQKRDATQSDHQQNKSAKEQQDLSKQRAESLLRQVRERERDYRELQKKSQAIIGGVHVEKDW